MQDVLGYSSAGDSLSPSVKVIVDGVEVDPRSVSVTREIASNLPVQIAGGSGVTAATGSLDWAPVTDVEARMMLPWDSSTTMPRKGAPVTVDSGYSGVNARTFDGIVEESSGDARRVQAEIEDRLGGLNRAFSMGPLADVMMNGGTSRRVGVHGTWLTDRLLRHCGYYATPRPWSGQFISAPLMGSTWGERGVVATSSAYLATGTNPVVTDCSWGVCPSNVGVSWTPDFSATGGRTGRLDSAIQLTFVKGPGASFSGSTLLTMYWGNQYIRMIVATSGAVTVQSSDGATVTGMGTSLTGAEGTVFSAVVTTAGEVTLYSSAGTTATGTIPVTSTMTGTPMDRVALAVPDGACPVGGVQLAYSSVPMATGWTRTAFVSPSKAGNLTAIPAMETRPALDILKEQAEAECAGFWLDEHGNLVWRNRDDLSSTVYGETLTPLDHITDVAWVESSGSVRHRTTVKHRTAARTTRSSMSLTVWQGNGGTYSSGDVEETIISVPDDEEWISVDTSVAKLGDAGTAAAWNVGRESMVAAVLVEDGQLDQPASEYVTCTVESISRRAYKLTTAVGTLPAGKELTLKSWETGSISESQRGISTPIVRAQERVEWADASVISATEGPDWAPDFEHDAAWFIQSTTAAQELADWLAGQTATAVASISSLRVIPDDRRQLGDIVRIDFGETYPKLVCLVDGVTNSLAMTGSGVEKRQELSVRVITVAQGMATLAAHDRTFRSDTLETQDAYYAGQTLAQHDAAPLKT